MKRELIIALFVMATVNSAYCQEKQISVYYPSPYGEYMEVRSERLVVGTGAYMQKSNVGSQDGVILVENGIAVTVGQSPSGGFSDYLNVKGKTARLRVDSNVTSDSLIYTNDAQLLVGDMVNVPSGYSNSKIYVADSGQTLGLGVVNGVGNYAGTGPYGMDINSSQGSVFIGGGAGNHIGIAVEGSSNPTGFAADNGLGFVSVEIDGTGNVGLDLNGNNPSVNFASRAGAWTRNPSPAQITYDTANDILTAHTNKMQFDSLDSGSFSIMLGNGDIFNAQGGGNGIVMDASGNLRVNGGNILAQGGNVSISGNSSSGNRFEVITGSHQFAIDSRGVVSINSGQLRVISSASSNDNVVQFPNHSINTRELVSFGCPAGQLLRGIDAHGNPICVTVNALSECRVFIYSSRSPGGHSGTPSGYSSRNRKECTGWTPIYGTSGHSAAWICIQCR